MAPDPNDPHAVTHPQLVAVTAFSLLLLAIGMLAPANLAQEHLDKLAVETAKAVKAPESLKRLQGDAAEAIGGTPAQFAQFIAAEQARWQKVIKRAGVKPD